jgi:CDP-diacylglycerol--glycerol-3-phosphate 3-phosphatidyltransferase
MNDRTRSRLRVLLQPAVAALVAARIPPNAVTISGLVLGLATGFFLSQGQFLVAGILLLLAGLADTLDGELARKSNRAHRIGAFLDSSFDRISEFAVFFGIFWFFRGSFGRMALAFAALFASLAVSYVRARAEGIGVECRIGWFERPIRFLFLVLGVFGQLFWKNALPVAMVVILAGAAFTVVQRVAYVIRGAK